TETMLLCIFNSPARWLCVGRWTRRGPLHRRDLRSMRASPSAASALLMWETIRPTSLVGSVSLRACGWPGCRKSKGLRTGARMSDPMAVSRRLVAVFAADVEGYSRLMGADEVGTLKGLTERRAILDRLIGEHSGRIANTAGDSVLAEFGSAV